MVLAISLAILATMLWPRDCQNLANSWFRWWQSSAKPKTPNKTAERGQSPDYSSLTHDEILKWHGEKYAEQKKTNASIEAKNSYIDAQSSYIAILEKSLAELQRKHEPT